MVGIVSSGVMLVTLSKASTRQGFFRLIDAVLDKDMNARYAHIRFDFGVVQDLGLRAIVVMSNLIELLQHAGVTVSFENYQRCPAAKLLREIGFYDRYFNHMTDARRAPTLQMLPLELVNYDGSHGYIQNRLTPWLEAVLDVEEGAASAIEVCMKEIFNNIVDHSTVNVGCSVAWVEPRNKRIEICSSDFGVGIPRNVRTQSPSLNDAAAVLKACEEGFTTKSSPRNRGAGLATLMQNVVDRNSGRVLLYSGKGYVARSALDGEKPHECLLTKAGYPGTLVHITLDPAKFRAEQVEEVFEW